MMHRGRASRGGRALTALGAAMVLATACSGDDGQAGDPTTTTAPSATIACSDGTGSTPVALEGAAGVDSVVDLVARPSGQIVAVGTSIWTREPGATAWTTSPAPPPLSPDQRPTAVASTGGGEVWIATSDAAGEGSISQISRSTDLVTWANDPLVIDGAPSSAAMNALALVADRWFALVQDREEIALVASADGRRWETQGAVPLRDDGGPGRALFDLAGVEGTPLSVGFTVGDSLRPLAVAWPGDGAPNETVSEGDELDQVRLWGLATVDDIRVIVAADQVTTDATGEATALTAALYERRATGALDLLTTLSSSLPFAVPSDLVVVGDQVIVAGGIGDTRRTLSPAVWTICLRP